MKTLILAAGAACVALSAGHALAAPRHAAASAAMGPKQPIPYAELNAYLKASPKQKANKDWWSTAQASTGASSNASAVTTAGADTSPSSNATAPTPAPQAEPAAPPPPPVNTPPEKDTSPPAAPTTTPSETPPK